MTQTDPAHDPARRRFFALSMIRITGGISILAGILVMLNKLFAGLPDWVGYVFLANGLIDFFVLPPILVRKWRTPE